MNQKQRSYTIKRLEAIAHEKKSAIRLDPKCKPVEVTQKMLAEQVRAGKLQMRLVESMNRIWLGSGGAVSVDVMLKPDPREAANKENAKRGAESARRISCVDEALSELKDQLMLATHPGIGLKLIEAFEKRRF